MQENKLEKYYLGDDSWKQFSSMFNDKPNTQLTYELENIFKNIALAKVIENIIGKSSLNWINKKIPALDNIRPIDCLNSPELLKRLKTMLMRM